MLERIPAVPVLILTTLLGAAVALWGWSEVGTARGLLAEQTALREAAEARLSRVTKNLRTVENRNASLRADLDSALRQNPEWSATPVPATVSDSLCKRGKCRPVGPVRTPGD